MNNHSHSRDHSARHSGRGGLAVWSMRHPVGVIMISLAVIVLGGFSLNLLNINLLPHLIYPEIRVRISDPGVPAVIMEDRVTRQLEEQLAITEDAVAVQSRTSEGRSNVDLSFEYGKDINVALRDASSRLDRAKRFLPDTISPPVIYKRDPSQIPVMEFVVSSTLKDPVELRAWVDDVFAKWFLNLPGVSAAEVGGGLLREIQVLPDQRRLAGFGLELKDIVQALKKGNLDVPGGRLEMSDGEIISRTSGRFTSVEQIANLPLLLNDAADVSAKTRWVYLREVAEIVDTHQDERLRIRLDGIPGVKLSIQKQPSANTVAVVDSVNERVNWLKEQGLMPEGVDVQRVGDQAVFVRHALQNAASAALTGALLAMIVVYIFLGNVRRTLIIGSAIPIAIMVTFILMVLSGLSLNIMTLGGLALGVGMLVDNTIVMLENIYRHQREGESSSDAPVNAAKEVSSAIVASTSTNLAAVLPFLFVSGIVGLLFRELIVTISAAIVASLVIAFTLVPALSAKVKVADQSVFRIKIDAVMQALQNLYARLVGGLLRYPVVPLVLFVAAMYFSLPVFFSGPGEFLPKVDEGQIRVRIVADSGISVNEMDKAVAKVEKIISQQAEVETVFSTIGGWVFGRSQYESSNKSSIRVQLVPGSRRSVTSNEWIERVKELVAKEYLPGIRVRMWTRGIRGVRLGHGDNEISLRLQGADLDQLIELGDVLTGKLKAIDGVRWATHSSEEVRQELVVNVDRARAASLGLTLDKVGEALRFALQGDVVSEYIEGDHSYDIRVRLARDAISNPQDLESIILFGSTGKGQSPISIRDVAVIDLLPTPSSILRDQQKRIVEVSATLKEGYTLGDVTSEINNVVDGLSLPAGYVLYDGGAAKTLKQGRDLGTVLLCLALFLVFVVMAVQYESLRNPLVILLCVPFSAIGVVIGINVVELSLSMPVYLGMIMLAGIVVNNSIVLVEYIEIERHRGSDLKLAITNAARLRLRPILMTTLTTVVGMMPLAFGLGEGAEMLQPLAVTIVSGLSFSMVVSLVLIPCVYYLFSTKTLAVQQV